MRQVCYLLTACVLALGQGPGIDVPNVLHGVERRYNGIKSLKVNFTETRIDRGGRHKPLSGVLYLEKPRKALWDYSSPAGEFYLSDGAYDYDYDPKTGEVVRSKVKEDEDLRGPLQFLLGKVDFDRDFGSYSTSADGAITAIPKSDKLLFTDVSFVSRPDYSIRDLSIKGQDGSTTTFAFEGEVANPPLRADLFKFVKPAGSYITDK